MYLTKNKTKKTISNLKYIIFKNKGMKLVEDIINEYNISCDLKKVDSFVYTLDENYIQYIKDIQ